MVACKLIIEACKAIIVACEPNMVAYTAIIVTF
jgi:hypothetical protein